MAGVWDLLLQVASLTRHVSELRSEMTDIRAQVQRFRDEGSERMHALELDVAGLKAAQATTRETVRAEIATAVADLRVQWAELEAKRRRSPLGEG